MKPSTKEAITVILVGLVALATLFKLAIHNGEQADQRKMLHNNCVLACQSTDVVVEDGKCGCITWKNLPLEK